ncbi:MAG: TonB-dependent receptor, partial [Marinoscillum sp.]
IGASYDVFENLKISANANYFDRLYAEYDPNGRTDAPENGNVIQPLELPSYATIDAFARFNFKLGELDASLLANVNNILDAEYIAEGSDNTSISNSNVYYGFGRTYTMSVKVQF